MPSALPTVGYSELLITSLLPTTEAVEEPCQSSGAELGVVLSMYRMYMLPTRRQTERSLSHGPGRDKTGTDQEAGVDK